MTRREQIAGIIKARDSHAYCTSCSSATGVVNSISEATTIYNIMSKGLDSCPLRGVRQRQPKVGEPICRVKLTPYVEDYMSCDDRNMQGCKTFNRINAAIKGENDG